MSKEAENYVRWKLRSKIISFAAWFGAALSIAAVVATYLIPDISNIVRLTGFLFLIINAIASPFLLYMFVRTKVQLKEAKSRYEQSKQHDVKSCGL